MPADLFASSKKFLKRSKKTIDNLWIICYNKDAPRGWQDRGE